MKLGCYQTNVQLGKMPQRVATAFGEIFNNMVGASYIPIAYIGSQFVNNYINHAILAEQTIVTGKDTKNAVLIIINEKPQGLTLSSIVPVLETGAPMGGTVVGVRVGNDIPDVASNAFNAAFKDFAGGNVKPIAYLGSQQANGVNLYFAAECRPLIGGNNINSSVKLITINSNGTVEFDDILG